MPIPLILPIGIAIVAGLIGGGITLILPRFAKKLADKQVAILGRQSVGKSTLLHVLREGKVPDDIKRTLDASLGGRFSMEVGGERVEFDVPRDLPGNDIDLSYKHWKAAFFGAEFVWYVFRADLIASGDASTIEGVRDHLNRFKDWMDSAKAPHPKIILIGTYADKAPDYESDAARFADAVRSADSIKLGMVKLNHADLVIGSLIDNKNAKKLVKNLGGFL